jgi:hypothetical protein
MRKNIILLLSLVMAFAFTATNAVAKSDKPNILVIWGDDVGMWNITPTIMA